MKLWLQRMGTSWLAWTGLALLCLLGYGTVQVVRAQAPTPVSACGTYSGNLILTQNISSSNGDCITIGANNTTFDGNGKTLTMNGSGHGVFNFNKANLTVRNLTSNSDVYIAGDSADGALIEASDLGGVYLTGADDITIRNNTLNGASIGEADSNDVQRVTITGNTIRGTGNKVLAIRGSGIVPCAPSNHTITNNTIISDHVCNETPNQPDSCDEPMVIYVWCSAGSTYSNNTISSTTVAQGIRIRDESDSNVFTNNTVTLNDPNGAFGTLNLTTGNDGKHWPRDNVFRDNIFRLTGDRALKIQGTSGGNLFERNVFATNSDAGAGVWSVDAAGDTFRNNTFYNTTGPAIEFDVRGGTTNTFLNNIFSSGGPKTVQGDSWSFNRYIGDYNLFYSSAASTMSNQYGTLSSWVTASGNTDDTHSAFANPLFVNASSRDFHLQSSSPARGMGQGGSDVGAFAYSGSPPPCTEDWSCGAWSACSNSSQSRTCTDANSCGTTVNRPPLTQSCSAGDTTAPTLSITAPTDGATVNGTITFSAQAQDNVAIAGVTFYVNGAALWPEDTTAPYSVDWDTTIHTNGSSKTLTAVARDTSNNTATATAITVSIQQNPACLESWVCTPWSMCANDTQTRSCTDQNDCGTTNTRPPLTQSCVMLDNSAPAAVQNLGTQ